MSNNLNQLNSEVLACQQCELRINATAPVCGIGVVGAKYLLIGEAPGREEDENQDRRLYSELNKIWIHFGMPFIGQAGKRLNKLLELAHISLNDCYLTNVCKCRPPANRDPRKLEIRRCYQWLKREIELVKPQYIITLGAIPLSLFSPYGVRAMHGTMFSFDLGEGEPLALLNVNKTQKKKVVEEET